MIFWKHLSETHERGSEIHESIATITQNTFQDSDNIIQKNQISKKKSFRPRPPPPPKKMTGTKNHCNEGSDSENRKSGIDEFQYLTLRRTFFLLNFAFA